MNIHNEHLSADWRKLICTQIDPKAEIRMIGIEGGGSINDARRVETSCGKFFAKINEADPYPGMFEGEARGLEFLRANSEFEIPKVMGTGVTDGIQWILMEYIDHAVKKSDYWEVFGVKLARMHRKSNEMFGLEKVIRRADTYFPEEPPAVLHGDLWTGNFTTTIKGEATIFDPAAYYGHREMDIAMSKLFGGFDARFYDAYNAEYPLEQGWESRLPIADLYPLLAHLNIFGGTYAYQIMNILRQNV